MPLVTAHKVYYYLLSYSVSGHEFQCTNVELESRIGTCVCVMHQLRRFALGDDSQTNIYCVIDQIVSNIRAIST